MLARITGTLLELSGNTAVIAPDAQPGLAYEVMLPAYLAQELSVDAGGVGGPRTIALHTIQYFEGLNQGTSFIPRLIGFSSARDREFFELLTSVKGLGNKRALRAMSVEPAVIARAISERNTRALQGLPEIGPKLAELIVHELKAKADRFAMAPAESSRLNAQAHGQPSTSGAPIVEAKSPRSRPKAGGSGPDSGALHGAQKAASAVPAPLLPPVPPVRQTVDALVALGETPLDAERLVARALDRARSQGTPTPTSTQELLTAAFAAR